MSITVAVGVFGPLRVLVGDSEQELHRRRERDVLATLVAAHGRPVSADRLVLEVWGEEASPKALTSLQVVVSRLRVLLEPDRAPRAPAQRLVSTASGYALSLPDEAVDAWAFERRAEAVRGAVEPAARLAAAEEACAVWTAEPFAGCEGETIRREADRLTDLYADVLQLRAQALLDLAEPERAVAVLAPLAPAHPYRERLWALLALAQYRSARQGDALETLRSLRARLADELGIDPSPEVTALERAVLKQDEALRGPEPAAAGQPPPGTPEHGTETVGRDDVVATLRGALGDLNRGRRTRFVLVTGEPGIGKTRLVDDLAQLARGEGVQVLTARCLEGEVAPPLWPWLTVLRALPEAADEPALASLLTDAAVAEEPESGSALRLFDAIARVLVRAAERAPLVMVLEDLHWADLTSLRMLGRLADSGSDAPLLVVATRRSSAAPTSDALIATMAQLARAGATRIRLEGLPPDGVAALLHSVLGEHDPRLDTVVAEASGGNPFFALEYARLVQGSRGRVDPARLPVPDGVRDVLRQRLTRLPDDARELLVTAAVAGTAIEPETVSTLTGVPVERVLDLLDLALALGLLADQPEGYAFAHALTREALAAELSAARRSGCTTASRRYWQTGAATSRTPPRRSRTTPTWPLRWERSSRRERQPPWRARPTSPRRGWPTTRRWPCGGRSARRRAPRRSGSMPCAVRRPRSCGWPG